MKRPGGHENHLFSGILILSISLLLISCDGDAAKKTNHEDIYGIWERVGYGDIFVINKDSADYYQYTRKTCIREKSLNGTYLDKVTQNISMAANPRPSAGFKTYFTRLNQLPANCQAGQLITKATPTQQFEHLWHNFNDYYAFFSQRGVDWQQQYTTYRPLVNDAMSQEALFRVLVNMLTPIHDSHVFLSTHDNDFSPEQPSNTLVALQQAFKQQSGTSKFWAFFEAQLENIQQVQNAYLRDIKRDGGPNDDVALWGTINGNNGNIGYIRLNSMAEISDEVDFHDTESQDLVAIENIMSQMVNDLQGVKALVIDVRLNGGGYDTVSLAIANHFTRQRQLALSKHTDNWQGRTPDAEVYLNPVQPQLHVPIAILSSGMTVSAAEIFLMAMRSIPEVSVIGEPSNGSLSDILEKTLLNGMAVDLSNEIYLDYAGHNYEARGVPVDIEATAFDLEGFANGKDTALDAALSYLSTKIP